MSDLIYQGTVFPLLLCLITAVDMDLEEEVIGLVEAVGIRTRIKRSLLVEYMLGVM